ncbi:hypothetical protein [Bacillus ectoiniformans]|uniref:hypothetical protein n=1 Tax=Bacillus ectoiniformans TaxID=1494429 RepID=UPI001EF93D74|nr:hypothetical protein [Bacillus ectoiniformans]
MMRKYNPYRLPPWLRTCRRICCQLCIPFAIFQGIRTLFLPTSFDVLLLFILIILCCALHLEWI